MLDWLKLSHHHHSGKLRPHEHTSYLPLGMLLLVVGLALGAMTASAQSPPGRPGPAASSVALTGTMPGPAPAVAAVIKVPGNGQRFSSSPVTVSGTCPNDTLVELFKNDIFAGSTPCTASGTFSLDIDLLIGQNVLVARVYDALNQAGPDSNAVTVFYDALPPQADPIRSDLFGSSQLILNTDAVYRGVFPGREMTMPINILGGSPPYALNIQWGDTTNKLVSRNDNVTFRESHVYQKAGTYQITLQASDAAGRVAFLTVAAIVNGQPPNPTAAASAGPGSNQLLLLWPLYTAALAVVVSFWLGEQREKQVLKKHGLLLTPQG